MQKIILKRDNKAYSLEELAHLKVTKSNKVRRKNESEWVTADQIDELKELLIDTISYTEVRKHYGKYPILSKKTVSILTTLFLITIGMGTAFLIPLFSKYSILEGLNIIFNFLLTHWKIITYTSLALGSILLIVYIAITLPYRYYRLIKITKKEYANVKTKPKVSYQIQKHTSFKKDPSTLDETKIRWRVYKNYEYDSIANIRISTQEEAKAAFDKLTFEKLVFEKAITSEKVQFKKPSVFPFIKEKLKIMAAHPSKGVLYIFGAFFTFFIIFTITWIKAVLNLEDLPTFFKIIIGVPSIILGIIYISFKIKILLSPTYCFRVIERKVRQGSSHEISYHLQLCPVHQKKGKQWQDINVVKESRSTIGSGRTYVNLYWIEDKKELITVFNEKTGGPKIIEEKL